MSNNFYVWSEESGDYKITPGLYPETSPYIIWKMIDGQWKVWESVSNTVGKLIFRILKNRPRVGDSDVLNTD